MSGLNRGVSGLYGGNAGLYGGNAGLYSGSAGLQAGGGTPSVAFLPENRPATIALSPNLTTAGDSLTVGVGTSISPTDYSWPGRLLTLLTSGTLTRAEAAGMAYIVPGQAANTNPIPTQIANQGATPLGANTQFHSTGLNDYNTGANVVSFTEARVWASTVLTQLGTIQSSLTGGSSQLWVYLSGMAEADKGPGMVRWADWRWLQRQASATYGGRVFDLRRYLMFKASTDPTNLDYINVNTWWDIPLSFRGSSSNGGGASTDLFANNAQTAWQSQSVAANTRIGIQAVLDYATQTQGTLFQNTNTSFANGNNIWRATASGWNQVDMKHLSRWGYTQVAECALDILATRQGAGAPVGAPAELFCAQDAAANTTVGTIYYVGAAPSSIALFDMSGTAITTLSLTDNGSTNNLGSITVKRSGSGTLTEGGYMYQLQTTSGSFVLHSPVDFRVGQPSTQTVPRMWRIPGAVGNSSSDFSIEGRSAHGLTDGNKYFIAGWIKPVNIAADNEYIIDLGNISGSGDSSVLRIRIGTSGQFVITANNTAGTLLMNASIASACADNTATWFGIDLDFSVATPTAKGYFNKAGAGADTTINATGVAATGPTTLGLSKAQARFFSLKDASIWNQNYAGAADATRDQFTGSFGNVIVAAGNVGIAGTPAIARVLWNLDNTPATRTPYSTIGGITPIWDIQGGIGDFLNGGMNAANEPYYGTYRGIVGLT